MLTWRDVRNFASQEFRLTPANKLSLQEINQLIGIELVTSSFLENFGS